MNQKILLNLSFNFIQTIRFSHAIMESDFEVCIPPGHVNKFLLLKKKFKVNFQTATPEALEIPCLQLSHKEPLTQIGELTRPLVFPHAILNYCYQLWASNRDIQYSFAGLVTEKRKVVLDKWMLRSFPDVNFNLKTEQAFPEKLMSRLLQKLQISNPKGNKVQYGEVYFWSSNRGRTFPGKAWDEEYIRLLTHSKFVLCPSGDYIWSYRFFESIMCGAIPIIESYCPAYEGFRFRTLDETVRSFQWSKEDAEYNFALCKERLTIPKSSLNSEISKLLKSIH